MKLRKTAMILMYLMFKNKCFNEQNPTFPNSRKLV